MNLELEKQIKNTFNRIERDYHTDIAAPTKKVLIDTTLRDLGFSQTELDSSPDRWDLFCERLQSLVELYMMLPQQNNIPKSPSSNEKPVKTKSYRKTFERRFHLVEFVVDKWARDSHSRIDWERVTAEWNEAHPYDQFEKPISLKSLFNKAIREIHILYQLVGSELLELVEALAKEGQLELLKQFLAAGEQRRKLSLYERLPTNVEWTLKWMKSLTYSSKSETNRRRYKIMLTLLKRYQTVAIERYRKKLGISKGGKT